jgi:hypothetical protein
MKMIDIGLLTLLIATAGRLNMETRAFNALTSITSVGALRVGIVLMAMMMSLSNGGVTAHDASELAFGELRFDRDRFATPFFPRSLRVGIGDPYAIEIDLTIAARTSGLVMFYGQPPRDGHPTAYARFAVEPVIGTMSVRVGMAARDDGSALMLSSGVAINDGRRHTVKLDRVRADDVVDPVGWLWRLSIDDAVVDEAPCRREHVVAPASGLWIGGMELTGVTAFQGMKGVVHAVRIGGRHISLFRYVPRRYDDRRSNTPCAPPI